MALRTMMTAACGLMAMAAASIAHAETLLYTLTPVGGPASSDITFELDSNPSVDDAANFSYTADSFTIEGVTVDQGGSIVQDDDVSFANKQNDGGLSTPANYFEGAVLYTGTLSDPTLKTETNAPLTPLFGRSYTLNVTDVAAVSAAPEPAAWLLIIGGFAGMGLMLRRAKKDGAIVAA